MVVVVLDAADEELCAVFVEKVRALRRQIEIAVTRLTLITMLGPASARATISRTVYTKTSLYGRCQ
jgi:hypothetical protein